MEQENKQKNQTLEDAIYVSWEEVELGYGTRPDGFSLHLSEEDFIAFEKDHWERYKGYFDSGGSDYSRPAGSPTRVKVSRNIYEEIKETKNGSFYDNERSLVDGGELVFLGQRTGWVPSK